MNLFITAGYNVLAKPEVLAHKFFEWFVNARLDGWWFIDDEQDLVKVYIGPVGLKKCKKIYLVENWRKSRNANEVKQIEKTLEEDDTISIYLDSETLRIVNSYAVLTGSTGHKAFHHCTLNPHYSFETPA